MHPRAERPTTRTPRDVYARMACQRCGYVADTYQRTTDEAWKVVAILLAGHDCPPRYVNVPHRSDWRNAWHALQDVLAELAPWLVVAAVVFVIVLAAAGRW